MALVISSICWDVISPDPLYLFIWQHNLEVHDIHGYSDMLCWYDIMILKQKWCWWCFHCGMFYFKDYKHDKHGCPFCLRHMGVNIMKDSGYMVMYHHCYHRWIWQLWQYDKLPWYLCLVIMYGTYHSDHLCIKHGQKLIFLITIW